MTVNKIAGTTTLGATSGTLTYPTTSGSFTVSCSESATPTVSLDTSTYASATVGSGKVSTTWKAADGTTKITVNCPATTNYKASSATYTLYTKKAANPISLSAASGSINYNGTGTFTVSGAQGTVTATSNDTSIATVSLSGTTVTMTGKKAGTATITVSAAGNANYYSGSKTYTVTVNKIAGTTTVSKTSMTLTYPTTSGTFTASCSESGTPTVSSNATSTATVSISSGTATVTWKAAGTATITVSCPATTNYNASSKTVAVTIAKGENPIALSASSGTIVYPNTGTFTVSGAQGTLSVSSSATGVATASLSSTTVTMTSVKPGSATITVSAAGNSYYLSGSKTYSLTVSKGTNPITLSASSGSINYNGTGTFTVSGAAGTLSVSSASTTIATVSLSSTTVTMTGKQAGSTTITVTAAGNDYYNSGSKTYSVTVNKIAGTTTVSKTSMTLTYPTTSGTFTASCSESGTPTVSSNATSTATVSISSGTATVTWKAAGTATITVSCPATTNYNASSKTVAVTIAKGTNTLTLSATSGTLTYNASTKTKTFTVSTNTSGGTLSVSSNATGVATASISGSTVTATYVKAGSATITVSSAATSYYNAASATYTLTIDCGAGYYSNSAACTICPLGTYTSAANTASSCTNVNAGCYADATGSTTACPNECPGDMTSAAGSDAKTDCKITCTAGNYLAAGGSTCSTCTKGNYCANDGTYNFNASSNQGIAACSSLSGVSVSGGSYTSAAGSDASTDCKYTAPAPEVPTYCATKTSNTVTYSGTAWPTSTYSVTAKAGSIISGNNTATATCSQCSGAVFSGGGTATSCTACPAQTSGWSRGTGTGWDSYADCYQTKAATSVSSYCESGQLKQIGASATTWATATVSTTFKADAGAYVTGSGASTTCSQCTENYYCPGGTTTRQACSSLSGVSVSGGSYTSAAGSDASTDCKYTAPAPEVPTYCATKTSNTVTYSGTAWPTSTYSVTAKAGSIISGNNTATATCSQCTGATYSAGGTAATCSSCDSNYQANTTAGKSSATQCQISCGAGQAVLEKNAACAIVTGNNYKTGTALVNYGSTSPTASDKTSGWAADTIYACPSSYSISGTAAGNHDARTDCTISCAKGTQVASANAACTTPSGTTWYTAAHSVSAGSTSGSNVKSCNTGYATANTTTATDHDEAADCKIGCSAGYYIPTAGEGCKVCTAGKYCSAISGIAQTSTSAVTGNVNAGYWNNGCGTNATGSVCSTSYSGGTIAAGYYGGAGATSSTGSGTVSGGYYSTGGGTSAKPTSAGTGCLSSFKCGKLSAAYYSNGGSTADGATCVSGKTCGTCDSNYRANTATGKTAVTQCETQCAAGTAVLTANNACATIQNSTYKGKYTAQHNVAYGSKSDISTCPTYYQDGNGAAGQANCINSCAAGTQVASANADCTTPNTTNWYTDVHNVTYGKTSANLSKVIACDSDYANSGTTAANHAGVTSCKVTCAAGTYVASSGAACTDVGSGYYRSGTETVSQTNTGTRNACTDLGAIYKASDAGRDASTDCYATTTAKSYVKTAKDATETSCPAGSYCPGSVKVYYNSTGGSTLCPAGKFCVAGVSAGTECVLGSYSAAGASACTACQDGKTTSAKGATSCNATCSNATGVSDWETASWATTNTMTNLCTIAATAGCSANYYKNSNACSTCSSGTNSKYTLSAAGTTSVNSCYLKTTEGKYVATKGAGETACISPYYCPGGTTIYYGTGTTTGGNSTCTGLGAIYKASDAGASKNTQCYATTSAGKYVTAKATSEAACPAGDWCAGSVKVYYGSAGGNTDCPSGYTSGTTGYSAQSQCLMSVAGGKYVATEKESSASGTCAAGYYKPAHTVNYGGTSSCSACTGATYQPSTGQASCLSCPAATNDTANVSSYGYWNGGSTGDHTVRSGCNVTFKSKTLDDGVMTAYSCYVDTGADTYGIDGTSKTCWVNRNALTCNGGYYNSTFNNSSTATQYTSNKTLTDLYANVCQAVGTGYYSANDALTRTACSTGLVTCGSGACANEADDCGRKLHMGANTIYLRSAKRGTPALNVKIGDKTFYGVLSTSLSSKAKVKNGTTTYSVVNDNQ